MSYSLEQLKAIASKLDLSHSPNIGIVSLTEKLEKHAEELGTTINEVAGDLGYNLISTESTLEASVEASESNPVPSIKELERTLETAPIKASGDKSVNIDKEEIKRLSELTFYKAETTQNQKSEKQRIKDAMKLIRVIITSNDKNKTSYQGEIFCVRNAVLPDIKKMVVFGHPTHVPQIMLNMIKEKQVQHFRKEKQPNGNVITKSHLIPAYNIQILPPLTRDELEAIKKKQLAEGFTGE